MLWRGLGYLIDDDWLADWIFLFIFWRFLFELTF